MPERVAGPFGGALAAGAISLLNARRLGLAARSQAAVVALALAGFAGGLAAASLVTSVPALAARTSLFSRADLRALVERATDAAIEETLQRGRDVPIGQAHLERALAALRPTTVDWLRTARNYVEFANQGGRYDDVLAYLDQREVKAAVKAR